MFKRDECLVSNNEIEVVSLSLYIILLPFFSPLTSLPNAPFSKPLLFSTTFSSKVKRSQHGKEKCNVVEQTILSQLIGMPVLHSTFLFEHCGTFHAPEHGPRVKPQMGWT